MNRYLFNIFSLLLLCLFSFSHQASDKRALTVTDIMKFKEIKNVQISDNGSWIAYSATPDRGAISGVIKSVSSDVMYEIEEGTKPVFSNSGNWAFFTQAIPLLEKELATKKEKKKLKSGLVLVNTKNGKQHSYKRVKSAAFSGNSKYVGILFEAVPEDEKDKKDKKTEEPNESKDDDKTKHHLKKEQFGSQFQLIELVNNEVTTIENVQQFQFGESGSQLAFSIVDEEGKNNKLIVRDLDNQKEIVLNKTILGSYPHFNWDKKGNKLAYLIGSYETDETQRQHQLYLFQKGKKKTSQALKINHKGWFISSDNKLIWSKDSKRLYFGQKPVHNKTKKIDGKISNYDDLFNVEKLLSKKELQVWHGDDPRIKPHQAKQYEDDQKHHYLTVYHLRNKKSVLLANESITKAEATNNGKAVMAYSTIPYRKEITWEGFFNDVYRVDLSSGKKQLVTEKLNAYSTPELSPTGKYVTFFRDNHFWLYNSRDKTTINLTKKIATDNGISFANELHDYPSEAPGYGVAGWLENDKAVLVYDRYDIWLITPKGKYINLTKGDGRERQVIYRIVKTDKEQEHFKSDQTLLIHAYYDQTKHHGFYQIKSDKSGLSKLLEDEKKFSFIKKAKNSDTFIFTREDMQEFPDLWVANSDKDSLMATYKKLTDVNPQSKEFSWGKPMLVNWRSTKGKPLQGVLIKPANYVEGKRYPVVVYFYRYFSQRMYSYNQMKVNHRPNFPFYTSNDYAVFLPDIKFDIGTPGYSATSSLVPGIEKIIDLGIADPDAIGLHGHSWSGYQAAFAITQTDIFKAAVAGAPVTNMTSAYSGIRLKSGLARQFQYEQQQSRIGATLYEKPLLYMENSPIFYADRINTPLLIQFGDIDGAVPWQQGIEMYLAMRRLDKPVIMLQYEGEPHHLKKYPNKVDYTLKMKAFFDHHLKGEAAPLWMTEGVKYSKPKKE